MADIDELTAGQVLADAEIAEFIKAMGLGIAEAQAALDANTVNQIPLFAEAQQGLGGRSLFDLGLSPAFYHYQHADITVSLQLSLKVSKDTSVGLGLTGSYSDTATSDDSSSDTSTETSSGTSSNVQHREAKLEVKMTTDGALSVGSQNFQLTGESPLVRIQNLGNQLRTTSGTGVERVLVTPSFSAVNPECQPPSANIVCTPNAVAFKNGVFTEAVIRVTRLPTGADETYKLNSSTSVTVTKQASTDAQAIEIATQIRAKGYSAHAYGQGDTFETLHFDFDGSSIDQAEPLRPGETRTNRKKLASISRAIIGQSLKVQVLGYTDTSGPDAYNVKLGNARRDSIIAELKKLGVPEEQMLPLVESAGEKRWRDGGGADNTKDPDHRIGEVKLGSTPDKFVLIRGDAGHSIDPAQVNPNTIATPTGPDNGFIFAGGANENANLSAGGRKIVIKGTDFSVSGAANGPNATHAPESYAANLARDVNANTTLQVKAWATGSICNLANSGDAFQLLLVTSESRSINLVGTSDVSVTSQFSKARTTTKGTKATGNRTVAFGATLDVRFSKQYDQNVTGNSTISARLVAIPAPPQFLDQIKAFLAE